jgi:arylsulfatase A-like enzyme
VRTVLVRANRERNDVAPEFYAGWDERFDARPESGGSLDDVLRDVLDRLANVPTWMLWIELDRLLPPWGVQQDVFEAYVEDLVGDTEGEEPVAPWADPPTGWFDKDDLASWELLHRTFAAVVTVLDAELGRVFELFRDRGLDRTAAWVVTADRGLPLGEHGLLGYHRPWLHEELVHVPLIVRLPEGVEAGRRVWGLTQPADLGATLARWFGGEPAEGFDLAPLIAGAAESVRPSVVTVLETADAAERSIRTPEWAYLLPMLTPPDDDPREPMLFERPDDRWEVNDLRVRNLDLADELERTLREAVSRPG